MPRKQTPTTISISTRTIVTLLALVGGIAFLWFIRDIVALFFVALLLAALIDPFADWFERKHIPRAAGVLVVYVLLAAFITFAFVLVIPPLASQLTELGLSLVSSVGETRGFLDRLAVAAGEYGLAAESIADSLASVRESVANGLSGVISTVADIVGGLATLILVLVLTFYMVVEEATAKRAFRHLAPKQYQPYLVGLAGRMQEKLGHWLRGQLILMMLVGLLTYIGLLIAGVEYALVLGIFAGIAELVPYAGPIIASIPAIIIAFTTSPVKALIVAGIYFVVQQLENSVLTPKIMQKSVGLNPVVSLFAILVGFKIGGVFGALLAIPVATMIAVLLHDLVGEYDAHKKKTK